MVDQFIDHLETRAQKPLTALTARDIETFLAKRKKQGCSPTTIQLDGKILRTAVNAARRQGLVTVNVAEAVELPTSRPVQRGTFSPTEVKMLMEAAEGEWKTLIILGYYTGGRLSDCCHMVWEGDRVEGNLKEGVDFTAGTICYWQQKTNKLVCVPLHAELGAHLEGLAGTDKPQKFIMPDMADKGPGGRHGLSEGFKRIVRKAGLDLQTVKGGGTRSISRRTFHALRHSFASALANAGVTPELRMKLTGHTTEAIQRGYTHHEMKVLQGAIDKLPELK